MKELRVLDIDVYAHRELSREDALLSVVWIYHNLDRIDGHWVSRSDMLIRVSDGEPVEAKVIHQIATIDNFFAGYGYRLREDDRREIMVKVAAQIHMSTLPPAPLPWWRRAWRWLKERFRRKEAWDGC